LAASFLSLCVSASYAYSQSPNDLSSDSIRGTVVNSVTHEPIGRALVYTADERSATLPDDHGHFELTLPGVQATAQSGSLVRFPALLQVKKPG
jgi:hypothetical protein